MKTKPQEKKSAKTLKGQLFGALSMMLVAAIALGTSTYAWFINNQTVEVKQMDLTVSTSTSMLVAVGKKGENLATDDGWTGYKSVITKEDIIGTGADQGGWAVAADSDTGKAAYDLLTVKMTPASVCNYALAQTDPAFYLTNNHVSAGLLDQFTSVKAGVTDETVGMGPVKRIPLKFSASSDLDVYFGKEEFVNGIADMVLAHATAGNVGEVTPAEQAAAIKKALRLAIVPQSDGNSLDDVTPVIFQFDAGSSTVPSTNNTDYQYITDKNQVYPDPKTNTADNASTDVATALKAIQDETAGKYAAIKEAATDDPWHIAKVGVQQTQLPANSTCWATVKMDGNSATVTAPVSGTPIFQLKAGKPRQVDVYFWLEGTDMDCLNEMSGYSFGLDLPFAGSPTPDVAP